MLFLRLHLGTGRPKCSSVDEKKKNLIRFVFCGVQIQKIDLIRNTDLEYLWPIALCKARRVRLDDRERNFRVRDNMAVNIRVKVHPVVLFQIADSYERRSQDNHRHVFN